MWTICRNHEDWAYTFCSCLCQGISLFQKGSIWSWSSSISLHGSITEGTRRDAHCKSMHYLSFPLRFWPGLHEAEQKLLDTINSKLSRGISIFRICSTELVGSTSISFRTQTKVC